ncbi:hypothetical protein [Dinoroseobacter sp. S375]|uniref:hypothetical protein n=1 Tax=Dinoroseobacter sp. S375 TaxID=3415136 RepID=UPI003C79DA88
MPLTTALAALLLCAALSSTALAASCPANAPEGYKWLPGYVDEYRKTGAVSSWFTDSLNAHPEDFALLALQAFFDAKGDMAEARALYERRGGSGDRFDIAMACAQQR